MYDEHYMNTDFNYEDLDAKYNDSQNALQPDPASLKRELDNHHKN